ncbi:MAG: primosomal protein N' [Abditibacteriota bacterium]|nr:primosomal protein N' [Abditibacteriota bacterium]
MKLVNVASGDFAAGGFDYLTYYLPDGVSGEIGSGVVVRLAGRPVFGYIIEFPHNIELDPKSLQPVLEVIPEGRITQDLIELAKAVSHKCFCPLSRTLASMIPGAVKSRIREYYRPAPELPELSPSEKQVIALLEEQRRNISPDLLAEKMGKTTSSVKMLLRDMTKRKVLERRYYFAHKPRRRSVRCVRAVPDFRGGMTRRMEELYGLLRERGRTPVSVLVKGGEASYALVKKCRDAGVLEEVLEYTDRVPACVYVSKPAVNYTAFQKNAIDKVSALMDEGKRRTVLLHGVTASGKTEVYMALIRKALEQNKTALVLLPEIALTNQVMNIFRSNFGDLVAVLHSNLSEGERLDEWQRVRDGRASIVLGARSCVFAPAENIGIIIIDEEHDGGYKQDNAPRYHARDVAEMRAVKNGCVLLLGSATPSVESYYRAETGEYVLAEMPERIGARPLPEVKVALLSDASDRGPTIFTDLLFSRLRETLESGRQAILLQNRRAYSSFILCRSCGWVAKCKNCDVTLKYHKTSRYLSCHHCDYSVKAPRACPVCGSIRIDAFGIGTQKVEEYVKKEFPSARCIRMDRDTTGTKGAHQSILNAFGSKEYNVLVGTQMIAKGLDFPGVTLVGIISADTDLNAPDFRAEERTFQLLSQVAGRAGRGEEPGEVIIQSFASGNTAIEMAARHDYRGFYRYEIENRRALEYPPFSRLVRIQCSDKNEETARSSLEEFSLLLRAELQKAEGKTAVYPVNPGPIPRINEIYIFNLLVKTADYPALEECIHKALARKSAFRTILQFDVDPIF